MSSTFKNKTAAKAVNSKNPEKWKSQQERWDIKAANSIIITRMCFF